MASSFSPVSIQLRRLCVRSSSIRVMDADNVTRRGRHVSDPLGVEFGDRAQNCCRSDPMEHRTEAVTDHTVRIDLARFV